MRNALFFFIITFTVSGFFADDAFGGDAVLDSAYVGPVVGNGLSPLDDDRHLLPLRGISLPGSGLMDNSGVPHDAPQASIIEAIPTPTAFNAGAILISAIIAGRYFRKLCSRLAA